MMPSLKISRVEWVGVGRGGGVTITVIALLNNFNVPSFPCPSPGSAIMIVKVQLECQLNIRISLL